MKTVVVMFCCTGRRANKISSVNIATVYIISTHCQCEESKEPGWHFVFFSRSTPTNEPDLEPELPLIPLFVNALPVFNEKGVCWLAISGHGYVVLEGALREAFREISDDKEY